MCLTAHWLSGASPAAMADAITDTVVASGLRFKTLAESQAQAQAQQAAFEAKWEPVAAYVAADSEEALEVSVIALLDSLLLQRGVGRQIIV